MICGARLTKIAVVSALLASTLACESGQINAVLPSVAQPVAGSTGNPIPRQAEGIVVGDGVSPAALRSRPGGSGSVWRWGRYTVRPLAAATRGPELVTANPDAPRIVAVAAALHQGLAMDAFGAMWVWDEPLLTEKSPTPPAPGRRLRVGAVKVEAVAAGDGHFLALGEDGTVWAWGQNTYGQVGDGTRETRGEPVAIAGLTDIVAVAAGNRHSLALASNGLVWAWGSGAMGMLGNGQQAGSTIPVLVEHLPAAKAIAGGGRHSLAVAHDGAVWAWGYPQLGPSADVSAIHTRPIRIDALPRATSVAAGWSHSLVLTTTGEVWAWGYNLYGQVGYPRDPSQYLAHPDVNEWVDLPVGIPRPVPHLAGIEAIAAGEGHNLALRADGSVWTWGSNLFGELGGLRSPLSWSDPAPVPGLHSVTAISARGNRSLALQGPPSARLPVPRFTP